MNVIQRKTLWFCNDNVIVLGVGELKQGLGVANDLAMPVNPGRAFGTVKPVAVCQICDVTVIVLRGCSQTSRQSVQCKANTSGIEGSPMHVIGCSGKDGVMGQNGCRGPFCERERGEQREKDRRVLHCD